MEKAAIRRMVNQISDHVNARLSQSVASANKVLSFVWLQAACQFHCHLAYGGLAP
jgi:hypothetical protein